LRHLHTKNRSFTKTGSGRTEEKLEEKRGVSAGVSLAAVALAFAALPSVVDKLVVGMRHEDEDKDSKSAFGIFVARVSRE
jgi:aryl-alcohol dehydrogenase-like predicted oxidoreductase